MLFWVIATTIALIVGAFLGFALLRGRSQQDTADASDLRVYRDQLKDVDKDLARGVIAEADAERIRTEISRRILAADAKGQETSMGGGQPKGLGKIAAVLSAAFLIAGTLGLYSSIGAPGYNDQPLMARIEYARDHLANRLSQADFEAQLSPQPAIAVDPDFLDLIKELRVKVKENPTEKRGLDLLARNEATLGNFTAAYQAQQQLIDLLGSEASSQDYTQLADLMARAARGYISPEADMALREALVRDPSNGFARYYTGLMMSQNGRPDLTFRAWRTLLAEGPENAPWIAPIRARIEDLAWIAGVKYTPPAPNGPGAADLQAAQDMSDEDRAAMVQSMVDGLAERLAEDGGTAAEWAQLITAFGVMGEQDRAQETADAAKGKFADDPEGLRLIQTAAQEAGLSE
ncbi:c-type cytochrome biogenesis protein CcmI [Cognatishimia sp. WU-CL00825]|uniref:c-type cytochrome biogenesis protein CcmI n=1 Tax=Cognatishimia sp. WU-CL00825 TaxID=3127658 RepID=UPI00310803E9